MVRFGPAGKPDSFTLQGNKSSMDIPKYLFDMGLSAFEYQCGHGVRIGEETARAFGGLAKEFDIRLSIHAPYYISLASGEEDKRLNSIEYILQSARAADWMGAKRVIVHPGTVGKMQREAAVILAKQTMELALDALDRENLSHINICPETMGKINQLGDLDEVLEICLLDDRLIPCIDFGHLNARTFGGLKGYDDFAKVVNRIEEALPKPRGKDIHVHFSKIEYTLKGGEKKHLTFEDSQYGPDFEHLMKLLVEREIAGTIICESAGTQAEDAVIMQKLYKQLGEKQ